jgi:hypothetical protein
MALLAWALLAVRAVGRGTCLWAAWLAQPRNVFFLPAGERRPAMVMVMKYVIVAGVPGDASYLSCREQAQTVTSANLRPSRDREASDNPSDNDLRQQQRHRDVLRLRNRSDLR